MSDRNHHRELYVPMARRHNKSEESSRIPDALAQTLVSAVFRGTPWSGHELSNFDPPPRHVTLDIANMQAGRLFTCIPWLGEQLSPPTARQLDRSVRSVLEQFDWEM